MNAEISPSLRHRLKLLWEIFPSPAQRRTNRGRLRTCRELTEHRRRAEQLYDDANTKAEKEAIDELITEIVRQRDELADGGLLSKRVRADRAERPRQRRPRQDRYSRNPTQPQP